MRAAPTAKCNEMSGLQTQGKVRKTGSEEDRKEEKGTEARPCVSVFVRVSPCLSMPVHVRACPCLSVYHVLKEKPKHGESAHRLF